MKITIKQFMPLLLLLVASATPGIAQIPLERRPDSLEEQVDRLLRESGLRYKKAGSGVWVTNQFSKSRGNFQLVLASNQYFLVAQVVVADRQNMRLTSDGLVPAEASNALLRAANRISFAKVGLDDDGALFVRSEMWLRTLNVEQLQFNIESVVLAVDITHQAVRPFLIK